MKLIILMAIVFSIPSCSKPNTIENTHFNNEKYIGKVVSKTKADPDKIRALLDKEKRENTQKSVAGIIMAIITNGASILIPVHLLDGEYIEYQVELGANKIIMAFNNDSEYEIGDCVEVSLSNYTEKVPSGMEASNECKNL